MSIHAAEEITAHTHFAAIWGHFKQLYVKNYTQLKLNNPLNGRECHFLLWCLHITQDDEVGLHFERDSV